MEDRPATRADIREAIADLKVYMAEREIKAVRWFVGTFIAVQLAYFATTLAAVWFLMGPRHG